MLEVLGSDELRKIATALFQYALQQGTYDNYNSILRSFFRFCEVFYMDPLSASLILLFLGHDDSFPLGIDTWLWCYSVVSLLK